MRANGHQHRVKPTAFGTPNGLSKPRLIRSRWEVPVNPVTVLGALVLWVLFIWWMASLAGFTS